MEHTRRFAFPENHAAEQMRALRAAILDSPLTVALHRARSYTRVFQENEGAPWIVAKTLAFREHLRTVPLFIREYDRIAGSICEVAGGMPVMVEIGIAENSIFTSEDRHRAGYLQGRVPQEIADYWEDRNLWGRYRAYLRTVEGRPVPRTQDADYKLISCQGHLSPSYSELLAVGLGGILDRVRQRRHGEANPDSREFLIAAEQSLLGVSEWIGRYAEFLAGEARRHADPSRAAELSRMSAIAARVAFSPPQTFREALQLIWFVHQAIHIEGHGYSNTPDRLDQILYPLYLRDKEAGRLSDDEALTLCENFILKMRDNTFWSVEHSLTQGVCLGGCSPEGRDQTNELSWLLLRAADNMSLPDPLVWIRWHPDMDQGFFDFCLETLAGPTCFPLMMSDTAVPAMFMELGVSREDAFEYVPVGCNELAIPGKAYFNPCAYVNYLAALEQAMTQGRGYAGDKPVDPNLPPPEHLGTFDDLVGAIGRVMRRQLEWSYADAMIELSMQMRWGQTPFTSCFFDGCIERAQDMTQRTRYNILASGGIAFANMTDCLAAIREVVYEKREATPQDVARACAANFQNHESLRAKLLSAPKHGNDDPGMRAIVKLVERLRVEPEKDICCDPRDGTPFATGHVVRSAAVIQGALTGATPDGRLAGTPLASSVAASVGVERSGPTAVLNSVLELDPVHCWRGGYNVNLRFQRKMLADARNREKVRAMLNSFFARGGQEMQINCVDTATLRAAQAKPDEYPDLVVRVAGFSEFFTKLDPRIQEDLVSRTEHE